MPSKGFILKSFAKCLKIKKTVKCECGGDKCRTSHAFWCPKNPFFEVVKNERKE